MVKKYVCAKCDKELASPQSLWNHKQRCKVTPTSNDDVTTSKLDSTHERLDDSVSSSGADYTCEICDPVKTFTRGVDLRRHVKQVHEKEKHYQCGICKKEFARKAHKEEHLKRCSYKTGAGKIEFTPVLFQLIGALIFLWIITPLIHIYCYVKL